jgi:hypothetical protein
VHFYNGQFNNFGRTFTRITLPIKISYGIYFADKALQIFKGTSATPLGQLI